ncbi:MULTISPECIES: sugar nucleotide-binding protein [unclassified Leeuwenhoekiella]|uniref:sugar nucleotide-binding protein n=1 Tax=unclassified Leeuwenhoekiella TaxID=2615029 RepID=UPI0032E4F985
MGASGFLGGTLYKELHRYYDTYGTYHTGKIYSDNQHFIHFDVTQDSIYEVLNQVRPTLVISALRGDFEGQVEAHEDLCDFALRTGIFVIYLSSANVFDAFTNYPSYEFDKTLSESKYGKLKIRCENYFLNFLPESQYAIIRLPMVFGANSPRIREIKNAILLHAQIEVFPHLIMNTTTDKKLGQQIHYIINRNLSGIFHLGSNDLIHHQEFIQEIVRKINLDIKAQYKLVYTSNFDRYLAVLPKDNKLPQHLAITNEEVLAESQVF